MTRRFTIDAHISADSQEALLDALRAIPREVEMGRRIETAESNHATVRYTYHEAAVELIPAVSLDGRTLQFTMPDGRELSSAPGPIEIPQAEVNAPFGQSGFGGEPDPDCPITAASAAQDAEAIREIRRQHGVAKEVTPSEPFDQYAVLQEQHWKLRGHENPDAPEVEVLEAQMEAMWWSFSPEQRTALNLKGAELKRSEPTHLPRAESPGVAASDVQQNDNEVA